MSKNIFVYTNLHRLFFLPYLNLIIGKMVSVCMSSRNTKLYLRFHVNKDGFPKYN